MVACNRDIGCLAFPHHRNVFLLGFFLGGGRGEGGRGSVTEHWPSRDIASLPFSHHHYMVACNRDIGCLAFPHHRYVGGQSISTGLAGTVYLFGITATWLSVITVTWLSVITATWLSVTEH